MTFSCSFFPSNSRKAAYHDTVITSYQDLPIITQHLNLFLKMLHFRGNKTDSYERLNVLLKVIKVDYRIQNEVTYHFFTLTISYHSQIPWRREWLPSPVFLPGESHGQRSLGGYSPWGRKESDTTEQLTLWLTPFVWLVFYLSHGVFLWLLSMFFFCWDFSIYKVMSSNKFGKKFRNSYSNFCLCPISSIFSFGNLNHAYVRHFGLIFCLFSTCSPN